jgi:hypothetical protein
MFSRRIRSVCRGCGEVTELTDTTVIGGEVFGTCTDCHRDRPDYVRSAASTARVLGLDVDDVRHKLRD